MNLTRFMRHLVDLYLLTYLHTYVGESS